MSATTVKFVIQPLNDFTLVFFNNETQKKTVNEIKL